MGKSKHKLKVVISYLSQIHIYLYDSITTYNLQPSFYQLLSTQIGSKLTMVSDFPDMCPKRPNQSQNFPKLFEDLRVDADPKLITLAVTGLAATV